MGFTYGLKCNLVSPGPRTHIRKPRQRTSPQNLNGCILVPLHIMQKPAAHSAQEHVTGEPGAKTLAPPTHHSGERLHLA